MDNNEERNPLDDLLGTLSAASGGMIAGAVGEADIAPLLATGMFVLEDNERASLFATWMRQSGAFPADISDEEILGFVATAGLKITKQLRNTRMSPEEIDQYEAEECPIHGTGPKADAKRAKIAEQASAAEIQRDDPDGWDLGQYL